MNNQPTTPATFHPVFLGDLSDKLTNTIKFAMAANGCPAESIEAVDNLVFLVILQNTTPETWAGGAAGLGGAEKLARELAGLVPEITQQIDQIDRAAQEIVSANYEALSKSPQGQLIARYQNESGWKV